MASPFSNGLQNAAKLFDTGTNGNVTFFNVSLTTLQTVTTVAHGFTAAPDFVLLAPAAMSGASTATTNGLVGWSATATTLTVTVDNTAGTSPLSVFAMRIAS